jgi:hypothetical protein
VGEIPNAHQEIGVPGVLQVAANAMFPLEKLRTGRSGERALPVRRAAGAGAKLVDAHCTYLHPRVDRHSDSMHSWPAVGVGSRVTGARNASLCCSSGRHGVELVGGGDPESIAPRKYVDPMGISR